MLEVEGVFQKRLKDFDEGVQEHKVGFNKVAVTFDWLRHQFRELCRAHELKCIESAHRLACLDELERERNGLRAEVAKLRRELDSAALPVV